MADPIAPHDLARARNPGIYQRGQIRMTPQEVDAYIAGSQTVTLSSVCGDGTVHTVAMWFGLHDGDIVFETKQKSQKVQNLRRDPRITVFSCDGEVYEELRGVQLVGRGLLVEDPAELWEIGVAVFGRNNHPYTEVDKSQVEAMLNKRVGIRFRPTRTVSWDHRKLGLSP